MTHLIRTTALVTAMATAAGATTMVQEIDVNADVSALSNSEAVAVWTDLEADLETALAAKLVNQIAEEEMENAAEIDIDVDTVALASSFETEIGIADSVLEGDVSVDLPGSQYDQRYTLTVTAEQANIYYPEGTDATTLNAGSDVFYTAMVDAFATHVAEKLK